MFIDEAKICAVAGRGGHGRVSFRSVGRSPYKRRPTGGNAGFGGDVFLKANPRLRTLLTLSNQIHWKADSGQNGGTNSRTGKSGKPLIIPVPVGTVIKDLHTQEVLADLVTPGELLLVAHGGLGGRGNEAFLSNRFKSPRISELGERGEERWLQLALKLLADVGLIGFPNAGKSTLISKMSSAKPKVGAYPFTTLEPKLGMVSLGFEEFAAVDIPGLIEGAHTGKGLGDTFLKHVERTRVLVHLVDLGNFEGRDPLADHDKINHELASFSPVLAQKPQIVVGNKIDLVHEDTVQSQMARFAQRGLDLLPLSAATGQGVDALIQRCAAQLKALADDPAETVDTVHRVYSFETPSPWTIVAATDGYAVTGPRIKRLGLLRLDTEDALVYLHENLERLGVLDALAAHGAQVGDTIRIGENKFEYIEEPSPRL